MDNLEVTLYYFFSTIAQTFAALSAFVYVAAQQRIAWLDTRRDSLMKATAASMKMYLPSIDPYIAQKGPKQVALDGLKCSYTDAQNFATLLTKQNSAIRVTKIAIATQLKIGVLVSLSGIAGIALSPLIVKCKGWFVWLVIVMVTFGVLFAGYKIGKFAFNSLEVAEE